MTPLPVATEDIMKNSILFVSGTLWAFSLLVGKSCPSAIYPFNTDDSNDGAILSKNSSTLDIPRDLSQPIIARFAREVEGEDPKVQKFHLLIMIIPAVMGVVVIIIIVLVVCYMRRRSERGTCFSNEWLIWCGLMKRGNPSSVPEPADHRSANAYVKIAVTDTTGQRDDESAVRLLTDSQRLQTPRRVENGKSPGAFPSERSPSLPDTPNTGKSSLPPTDDESDRSPHSETTAMMHHSKPLKFRYPNHVEGHIGSSTDASHGAIYPPIENIQDNENTDDGRDNCKADRSGSDDDVSKPDIDGVSDTCSEDICQVGQRKSPSNASPGDTYQVISGNDVHVHFHSPVDTVHVGDRKTKQIFFPKDSTDTFNNNSCAFNRFSRERKTH